ncbi:hypothetical protein RclHR1_01220053 [Rhizophagus clarus]|uniref:Uncharacterized protein n=1 Tax=Rhizophagus clarus TaxID=94130 RepID=A0A2Z6Q6K4_9GLOM|nr:hypothetical protein RclHR1_01220053 [Rhizophagus clarus]
MSSELESLKQRITELEAENIEIAELRKENAELRKENTDFRMKFANFEAERAELKRRIAETLRITEEERTRRDAENVKLRATIEELRKNNTKESAELRDRITKVEQKQTLNDNVTKVTNSSNNSSSNFNLLADQVPTVMHHEKPLVDTSLPEDKETVAFLGEEYKKKVSNEIRQRNREKKLRAQESLPTHPEEKMSQDLNSVTQSCNSTSSEEKICSELDSKCKKGKGVNKLKQELFAPELPSQVPIDQNHVTKISETAGPGKSSIDEASQHLAQLCDKAFNAEDGANRANQEEILCWCLYAKDFRTQLNEIIENSDGKFGEKKARSLLYDSITKHLNLLRKQRSQELGLHLPEISRDALRKKTQRAEKIYTLFEEIGLDKIKLIKTYSANSISKLTNGQIREIIEEQIDSPANTSQDISSEKIPQSVSNHVTEISETAGPEKNLPGINAPKPAEVSISTAPIPSTHVSAKRLNSNSLSEASPGNTSKNEVSTSSTISSSKVGSSNRSGLPVSILPENPEEKRKHIIGLVLEKFPYLSLDDSDERRDTFNLDGSTLCPLCNGDHKVNRSIFDEIKGEWGAGEYYGEQTYRLKCRESFKPGIPIVSVKA